MSQTSELARRPCPPPFAIAASATAAACACVQSVSRKGVSRRGVLLLLLVVLLRWVLQELLLLLLDASSHTALGATRAFPTRWSASIASTF